MSKLTLYPCISKDSAGNVTVTAFIDLITGTTYTPAEVSAMDSCAKFDYETKEVCYTVDGGTTVLPGGTYTVVYEVDPDTGLPNITPIEEQLLGNDGAVLDLTDALVLVQPCPKVPESDPREVCVDTDADGFSDQKGLQHITYSHNADGTITKTSDLTELDGITVLVGVVVECPETFFGTPIEVCTEPATEGRTK